MGELNGEGTAAPPQTQEPPCDSRFASLAPSALCCTSTPSLCSPRHIKANSSFKKCREQENPVVVVLERVVYSVEGVGFPHCQERSLRASRNKLEMLDGASGDVLSRRNRAPGQGCSSRVALLQEKEPGLCIKEYAGILHLHCWFKFISVWEINKYDLINVWLNVKCVGGCSRACGNTCLQFSIPMFSTKLEWLWRTPGSLLFSHPLLMEGDIPRAGTFHVPCRAAPAQGLPEEQSHQTQIKRK